MEDSRWKESAEEWQRAYVKASKERDTLEARLLQIRCAASGLERGCDCDHDYRCTRCNSIVELKNLLDSNPMPDTKDL